MKGVGTNRERSYTRPWRPKKYISRHNTIIPHALSLPTMVTGYNTCARYGGKH